MSFPEIQRLWELEKSYRIEIERLLTWSNLTERQLELVYQRFATQHRFHLLETLYKIGVPVRKPDQDAAGALWYAALQIDLPKFTKLLQLGADLNEISFKSDKDSTTALDALVLERLCASSAGEREAANAIIDYAKSIGAKHASELIEQERT